MKEFGVLTAIGHDRIGFVDDLTQVVEECGGNIEESKMVALGGEFAVVMLFSGEKGTRSAIEERKADVTERLKVTLDVKETTDVPDKQGRPYLIETVSLDTLGIVHRISHILKSLNINIEDLETDSVRAPWTGTPMFKMRIRVTIPPETHLVKVRDRLNETAEELDLDLSLNSILPPAE